MRSVESQDYRDGFRVLSGNEYYLRLTDEYPLTVKRFLQNITELPPGAQLRQKHFLTVYRQKEPIALMDAVEGYPDRQTIFLGLLAVERQRQKQGLGSAIVAKLEKAAVKAGFKRLRLGCWKKNECGMRFWQGKGFLPVGTASKEELVILEKIFSL